ncbi:MAG TPA: hypothetical protein VLB69_11885 [Rudaea sp.]|nr:hypothetical protein [Rudaea sp.]
MTSRHSPFLIAIGCALLVVGGGSRAKSTASCARDCASEPEPTLPAPALVQPSLLSGPNFRVVPEVEVRGYMAHFLIDTPYGPLTADSVDLLAVRVSEIPAIEALDRASRTDAFAHALAERGRRTGAAVIDVIAHPIDTVTGLPAGVVRYLRKQLDTLSGRAQSLADQTSRHTENRGDPFRAPDGPMTAGRDAIGDGDPARVEKKNRAWYARAGSEAGREAKRYLKYSQQRREMAKVLGVDPNTTNPVLNDKLDSLAWAAVGGNFSAGEALGTVTGTAATVISDSGKLNQYVLEVDPEQLRETIHRRLLKYCSDDDSIRSFLHRGAFTDTLRVALTESIEKLDVTEGCNELIELAATTRAEVEARYLVAALKSIRQRVPAPARGRLLVLGAAPAWRTADGAIVLPLPVDYLTWSHDIGDFFDQPEFAARDKTVLIAGEASMTAQRELTDRGWNLVLRATYEGAPAYSRSVFAASGR